MIEDKELHTLFKAESAEHLARLDDGLLRLEKTPTDPELLEEVFRESHSMKGAARMLGLGKIETAAHGLESIFNAARKGETPLTPDVIEHMNVALVDLRRHVQEALSGETAEKTGADLLNTGDPSGRKPIAGASSLANSTDAIASKPVLSTVEGLAPTTAAGCATTTTPSPSTISTPSLTTHARGTPKVGNPPPTFGWAELTPPRGTRCLRHHPLADKVGNVRNPLPFCMTAA